MSQKPVRISRSASDILNVDMTGKNIIITGSTGGIGKETARNLARMGGNIIFATRNREKTQDTIAETRKTAVYRLTQKSGYTMLDITACAFIGKNR